MTEIDKAATFNPTDPTKKKEDFRNYTQSNVRFNIVDKFYRENHTLQTVDYVRQCHEKWLNKANSEKIKMGVWEAMELLNEIKDDSDPDTNLAQIEHCLQSAESVRKEHPDKEWFTAAALIHDLGKVMCHPKFGTAPGWATVGDTFPVGCKYSDRVIFYHYFQHNPDNSNPQYNTDCGMYSPHCGFDNILMSWGHDEYMYQLAAKQSTLPKEGLYIIRYHSFYAAHRENAYQHLMNEQDHEMMKWVKEFCKYDLYSKSESRPNIEELKPYYLNLIKKYFPDVMLW